MRRSVYAWMRSEKKTTQEIRSPKTLQRFYAFTLQRGVPPLQVTTSHAGPLGTRGKREALPPLRTHAGRARICRSGSSFQQERIIRRVSSMFFLDEAPKTIDRTFGKPHTYSIASRTGMAPDARTDIGVLSAHLQNLNF